MATKKKGPSAKLTDAELLAVVKKFATVDGATKSGVVKAVRRRACQRPGSVSGTRSTR